MPIKNFEVIPAIDILDGKCVRLIQGKFKEVTMYSNDPTKVAKKWEIGQAPRLHVVDLNGARDGHLVNLELIKKIKKSVTIPIQVGGGIRDAKTVDMLIAEGIDRVILGTSAVENIALVNMLCAKHQEKIIISLDVRDGLLAIKGWAETSQVNVKEFIKKLEESGVKRIIYTDIHRDGLQAGPNFRAIEELVSLTQIPIIASGGIARVSDIKKLIKMGLEGCIVGKALYTRKIKLEELFYELYYNNSKKTSAKT